MERNFYTGTLRHALIAATLLIGLVAQAQSNAEVKAGLHVTSTDLVVRVMPTNTTVNGIVSGFGFTYWRKKKYTA